MALWDDSEPHRHGAVARSRLTISKPGWGVSHVVSVPPYGPSGIRIRYATSRLFGSCLNSPLTYPLVLTTAHTVTSRKSITLDLLTTGLLGTLRQNGKLVRLCQTVARQSSKMTRLE